MNTTDFIKKLREDPDSVQRILITESSDSKWYASIFWSDDEFWTNAFCFIKKEELLHNIYSISPELKERIHYA